MAGTEVKRKIQQLEESSGDWQQLRRSLKGCFHTALSANGISCVCKLTHCIHALTHHLLLVYGALCGPEATSVCALGLPVYEPSHFYLLSPDLEASAQAWEQILQVGIADAAGLVFPLVFF